MLLAVCSIVAIVLAANALLHIRSFRAEFINAQKLRATALVQGIVEDISHLNQTMSIEDMAGLLNRHCFQLYELSQKDGVSYIAVLQKDGKILAHSSPDVSFGKMLDGQFVLKALGGTNTEIVDDGKILHSLVPTGKRDDVFIAVGWKREGFENEIKNIVIYFSSLFIASILIALILSWYLLNNIFDQLDSARRRAESASRAKSDFLSNMSHEIRTPMNSVIGLADLLLNTPLNETQVRYVKSINMAGEALIDLINTILEIARFESTGLQLKDEPFELSVLINQVYSILEPKALSKDLSFEIDLSPDLPPFMRGDLSRIRQVLINFLSNAIKFTKKGQVRLTISPSPIGIHMVQFTIQDTGIGIPNDKLSALFKRFSQIDESITREYGGSGLGLAINHEIIKAMGGHIEVKSQVDQGTVFTFIIALPPAEKPLLENPVHEKIEAEIRPLDILLADDTEESCDLIKLFLKALPYQLDIASNGKEAVELFKTKKFDLVLMDIQMPILDGISATKMIREWEKEQHKTPTPIVALTANALLEESELIMSSGFDLHLTKPIKKANLVGAISDQTKKKE